MPHVNKKNSLTCNYCKKTYHGGITRIKYHLGKVPKCGVAKCEKVPSDVKAEMIKLLSKKLDNKQRKARDKEDDRAEVDLSHSEGEHSDADGNSVIVLKKVTGKGASLGGPIDRFCKLTPEEIVAARKGKGVVTDKVQSKISTEKGKRKGTEHVSTYASFFMKQVSHTTQSHFRALILCLRLLETLAGT
jgi:hypothetical protein